AAAPTPSAGGTGCAACPRARGAPPRRSADRARPADARRPPWPRRDRPGCRSGRSPVAPWAARRTRASPAGAAARRVRAKRCPPSTVRPPRRGRSLLRPHRGGADHAVGGDPAVAEVIGAQVVGGLVLALVVLAGLGGAAEQRAARGGGAGRGRIDTGDHIGGSRGGRGGGGHARTPARGQLHRAVRQGGGADADRGRVGGGETGPAHTGGEAGAREPRGRGGHRRGAGGGRGDGAG